MRSDDMAVPAEETPAEPKRSPRRSRRSRTETAPAWQCAAPGCDKPHVIHRLCDTHHQQRARARQRKD